MSIIIGADFIPTKSNQALFEEGNLGELLGSDLMRVFQQADYRIFNLELPLTDQAAPIEKCGPRLIASEKTVAAYTAAGVDLFTLANNHILDHGLQGLEKTESILRANGIAYCGVGENVQAAARPYVFEMYGKRIGVYACAEHEFSIATEKSAGANPFDPLETPDHVAQLKAKCDYVIVLYHGGKEYYRYPSPMLQKYCRKMAEKGADLILCQHSHCIGCMEEYCGSTIVYGQGNFLFDASDKEFWLTSLLVTLDEKLQVSFLPLVKEGRGVRLATGEKAGEILDQFRERSRQILQEGFIENSYAAFAAEYLPRYLYALSGRESKVFRVLNKLSGNRLRKRKLARNYGKTQFLSIRNYVECEAHHELLLWGITK